MGGQCVKVTARDEGAVSTEMLCCPPSLPFLGVCVCVCVCMCVCVHVCVCVGGLLGHLICVCHGMYPTVCHSSLELNFVLNFESKGKSLIHV